MAHAPQTTMTDAPTITQQPHGSETTTDGVQVRAAPAYLPDQSNPDASQYVFGYRIRILNRSDEPLQLVSRRWLVIDAKGEHHTVVGEGVVGQQPHIAPGAGFEYSSYCPIQTAWGTMEGGYQMRRDDGSSFEAAVGRFYLVMPNAQH